MTRPLPPTYLLIALILVGGLHIFLPGPLLLRWPWRVAGILPLAAGLWLNLAADALFRKRGTEVKPFHESTVLVAEGPYRFTRHPMYLGMVLLVLGAALLAGSTTPLILVVLFAAVLRGQFVIPEEAAMRRQFGSAYEAYAGTVRRWLGRRPT